MPNLRRVAGRAGWTVADQLLYALSNLVVSLVLARLLDAEGFGAYATVFMVFAITVAVGRSVAGQPLQIRHSADGPRAFRRAWRDAAGASVLIGCVSSAICAGFAVLGPASLRPSMAAVAIAMPFLLLHDVGRMACFTRTDAKGAALGDIAWNGVLAVSLVALWLTGRASLFSLTLAWGLSSIAGVLVIRWRLGLSVSLPGALNWLREKSDLWKYLLGEYIIGLGAAQVAILIAGALTTTQEVGSLRGAQVLLGPLTILSTSAFQFAIPELSKRTHLGPRQRARLASLVSVALSLTVPVYLAVLLWLPDQYGEAIFSDTWYGARAVLAPMAVMTFIATLATGPGVTLYSLGQARITFWLHLAKTPLLLGGIVVGALNWGAVGAATALAVTEAVLLPAWILCMRHVLQRLDVEQEGAGEPNSLEGEALAPGSGPAQEADPEAAATAASALESQRRHDRELDMESRVRD